MTGGATAQAFNQIAPSATAGIPIISQGAAAYPIYGTAVVAGGGTGVTSLTAYAVLTGGTTSTNPIQSIASVGTTGQVLTSNGAGALPTFQTPSSVSWVDVTGSTQLVAVGVGYVSDNASQITYTLPATPALGNVFEITGGVSGAASGSWLLAQPALQKVNFGNTTTTTGVSGSIASTNQYDSIRCVCVVAGASAVWNVISSVGNLIVT